MFNFENFPVYKLSEYNYCYILKNILSVKKIERSLKDQLKRASMSIILNIAEGSGKFSKPDKKNFFVIARGSVNECVANLRLMKIEWVIDKKIYDHLYENYLEIAKMLSWLIKSMMK